MLDESNPLIKHENALISAKHATGEIYQYKHYQNDT